MGDSPTTEPPLPGRLAGRRVTLCVSGSIAAYKAVLLLRLLLKQGAEVEVVLTESAQQFVGAATFAGLTGKPVHQSMFASGIAGELHVELAARSDLVLIVPATADTLARIAQGRADDLTAALVLCATCPILAAPAMHPSMWSNPATQRNVQTINADRRVAFVGPAFGEVASGDSGLGRMVEPEAILASAIAQRGRRQLRGNHVVVSAGPTAEDLDPVRFIGNRSSGKMGFAIAERAAAHGASVTLIAGPVALPTPPGVQRVDVRSAKAMQSAIWQALKPDLSGAQALIMAAAVADFRPAQARASKIKRSGEGLSLELVANDDILAEVGQARKAELPVLVGFALETDSDARVIASARSKLASKRVDLVVANHADESIGRDDIRVLLVGAHDCTKLEPMSKEDAADHILSFVADRLRERGR
ncbi:MAG TPA: bifunctional phosphopantothenoylcysteine decarboxylase/phosphopantothenate--cysteine ligase CoaBC [Polyangiaceae bacterium]|nr:bifunctional phosphopantothenoylcysteine decarboxylase/phosphopantothenate--cysteine ligase CoaBC [Polyangiaceae bacterium]